MTGRHLVLAAVAAATISVAAAGCGRTSSASGPTVPSIPVITSTSVAATGAPATGPTVPGIPATTTTSVAAPTGTGPQSASVSADLAAVQSDDQAVQAGTSQSDADFAAGTSAQGQPDQP